MGLFSSKKKTFVSSSVWNMAGDIKDRADYLKSVVVGNVILDSSVPLGQAIPSAYLNGPGMGLRRYARWAKGPSNYDDDVGYVGGGIAMGDSMDPEVLKPFLTVGPNEFVVLNEYDIGFADSDWWAEEYMINNHQDLLFTDWFSEYSEVTGDITITFEDTTTTTFTPVGFDPNKSYLYALYQAIHGGISGPTVSGSVVVVPDEASFPPVPSGYTLYSDEDTTTADVLDVLTVVDVTYSDATPPEHTETPSTIPVDLNTNTKTYHKYTLVNHDSSTRDLYIQTRQEVVGAPGTPVVTVENEDIGGGVIKTTTTTVTTDEVEMVYSYHDDVQTVTNDQISEFRYFRYEKDTGEPDLDALFALPSDTGQFLPYIPIRIDNAFIRDTNPTLYGKTKRAYFKAMAGGSLNKLVKKIEENDQLGDLDFVYAVYGTSLNSPERTAREYMYRFFDKMASTNPGSYTRFTDWQAQWALADASMEDYNDWASSGGSGSGTPPPVIIPYPALPVLKLDMLSTTSWMNFHMSVEFNGVNKISGTGLLAGHKKGDYWIESEPTLEYIKRYVSMGTDTSGGSMYQGMSTYTIEIEKHVIYYQETDNHWEALELYGLVHKNYVYDGKWVIIKGSEAMADPEESGFIIPLHEETLREMRLVDSTQLATACCYLMFNCYKVVKTKWYQSGWFKILLIVVIIVISVVFPPAAGAGGVLGSSAAVGTAIGFTGTAAIVAGTIANAIAAIIIAKALTAILGDTVGSLVSTALIVALTAYGGVGGGNFDSASFTAELAKADNLMAITDGLVKSVNSYMQEKSQGILAETQRMMQEYKADMLEVAKQYEEMFGDGRGVIDPLMFTNSTQGFSGESREDYLERTLMCGSDVARMSQDLINDFAAITINTDLPS